ncbi:uncharacterized protein DUF998 [Litoreibacter ponti]|uniref:Uncharacterized protein DUF998 n=1 Tax=Litoreibacter ponti TaxID=1510457 RepID=A0A2T6BKK0_9RHOB|nr:DUF998 domain-containing protein [Litoreibacter ponti]PTX56589.1 uncharacterized protein DUF998 [Litoreibacter ponti]
MGQDTARDEDLQTETDRPFLLMFLATVGALGCVALFVSTAIGPYFVPNYDWVSDTISDLAAGEGKLIMDYGLYGFAAGLLAVALAASHGHMGGAGWSVGLISIAILAALVTVIGARNEYGDGDNEGTVIHIYLVYGLGVFFLVAPLAMAGGAGRHGTWAKYACYVLAGLWALSSPVFFFLPTSIDGLYERLLGVISCLFILLMSYILFCRGWASYKKTSQ